MSKRSNRDPALLHRAPFRLDLAVARAAVAATQLVIAEALSKSEVRAPARSTAKLRATTKAPKKPR